MLSLFSHSSTKTKHKVLSYRPVCGTDHG